MRIREIACLIAFVAANTCAAEVISGQYLVKFRTLPDTPQEIAALSDDLAGAQVRIVIPERNIVLVRTEPARIPDGDVLDKLRARGDVEIVQPNFRYRAELFLARETLEQLARAVREGLPFPMPRLPGSPAAAGKPEVQPSPPGGAPAPDPMLAQDRDLELANAKSAWSVEAGDRKSVVAVIDTGVDYNHEDLAANIWRDPADRAHVGWDFVNDDARPFDVTQGINPFTGAGNPGHGTHCAGNVGAVGDNGVGTSGIAKRVSIMAIRMLNEEGSGETVAGIKSIDYAVEHGAAIVSASWGSEGPGDSDDLLKESIQRAEAKGVLFVAAAGNTQPNEQKDADNDSNPSRRTFPASFGLPNILSVAASDQNGHMAGFTHFGARTVHLAAPGEQSFSTVPSNRDATAYPGAGKYEDRMEIPIFGKVPWNGTSMATPQVAGAAALLLSRHPDWAYAKLRSRLMETVRPEPTFQGKTVTGGVLDVSRAIR